MNDFKSSSPEENITKSCIFESSYFFWWYFWDVEILLIHSKNNNFHSHCSTWWNKLWSETYKTVQNPEPAICRCSERFSEFFLKNFDKFTEIHLCWSLFFNKVASELWQNFMRNFFIEHLRTTASENERLSFYQNKGNSFLVNHCIVKWPKRH